MGTVLVGIPMECITLDTMGPLNLFYDDQITHPNKNHVYNDAAPSTSFFKFIYSERYPELIREYQIASVIFEICPVIVTAILWGHEQSHKSILIYSDNLAVIDISVSPTIILGECPAPLEDRVNFV